MSLFSYTFMNGSSKDDLIFVDNDPQGCKLLCCSSFGIYFFSIIQAIPLAMLGDTFLGGVINRFLS